MNQLRKVPLAEQELCLAQIRSGMAVGGGSMSPETESLLRSVWNGERTYEEVIVFICEKYGN